MSELSNSPLDRLWKEYGAVFQDYDDLTLARWLCQTLGQLEGRTWRLSHPLLGAYRLGAQLAHDRQIWLKRLAFPPSAYLQASCCRAPLLPLFTRDILEAGLICQHCGESCIPFEEIAPELRETLSEWAQEYSALHAVAHWEEPQRQQCPDYDQKLDETAQSVQRLLEKAVRDILPRFLDYFPALVWEDQDECLEVRPEDIQL